MAPPSASFLLLILLLAMVLVRTGAPSCSGGFRAGQDDFVLYAEDAVKGGAVLLSSAHVPSPEECERMCCTDPQCNLALVEPRDEGAAGAEEYRTCVMFDCVHRNRFACRFISQTGFRSYVKESVFVKHLGAPQGSGEHPPPIAVAGRDVVVQPGSTVTLNGVESLAVGDASISDYQWSLESGDDTVSMQKTDFPDQVQISNLHPGTYIFQLQVTDSRGKSNTAKTTILVLNPDESTLYCLAPAKVGPCRASFPRWRYDATTGECQEFVFGGCKPNNNNYLSKNECTLACSGVTASSERRDGLLVKEVCGSSCGTNQLTCDNGCCLDKTLECDGVKQCEDGSDEDHCNKLNRTLNRLLSIDVSQRKAWCTEPPLTGPCRASHTRWYYDPLNRKCQRFTYGGCNANDNNFEEEQKCSDFCNGVTADDVYSPGMFKRFESEDEDESDSGSVALAVILAVAILALLAILTYCFLRARRERAHQPVATGPAHVALSEQDTLVYNSTTKPI
ncbi:kunitz-type protease inhibitor 1-like [Sphaeramia orbicularis]|uniref:kunitz-type protease inhibitor 1-like n=1 Tax=Sphaeramia orbicularis TaxID=375764 RepID=UPI00117D29F4|nr:kunitz-type protease inhibitor 1-like [Sphaeramia orbicularis]